MANPNSNHPKGGFSRAGQTISSAVILLALTSIVAFLLNSIIKYL